MQDTLLRLRDVATVELVPDRTARRVIAIAAFALATAFAAHVRVPLPFTPVPVTLQTLFVILAGVMLGPRLGAASMAAYLGMGIAGLPVFATGIGIATLVGPAGGYLLAFPVGAYVAGVLTRPPPDATRGAWEAARLAGGIALASLVILASGTAWLAILGGNLAAAIAAGLLPFLAGDVVKIALTTLIAWKGRDRTLGLL